MSYTVSNTDSMRGNCHSSRCVSNLNDGNTQYSGNDWLTESLNAGNIPTKFWVILDLGTSALCLSKIGIWNQNEYSDSHREVTSFDLYASDSTSSFSMKLLDGATLAVSGGANPNPERQVSITAGCIGPQKRYLKFVARTMQGMDGYGGLMEIKLYGTPLPPPPPPPPPPPWSGPLQPHVFLPTGGPCMPATLLSDKHRDSKWFNDYLNGIPHAMPAQCTDMI